LLLGHETALLQLRCSRADLRRCIPRGAGVRDSLPELLLRGLLLPVFGLDRVGLPL
jgi:hypothetical protein